MQDKAIAQIGHWQLELNKDLDPVDLYIENMFPGKDYQMLLLVFEITNNNGELTCVYNGIDIEKVGKDSETYRKYAYRKGTSGRAGDVTITTKISDTKKLENIRDFQFPKFRRIKDFEKEAAIFKLVENEFNIKFLIIRSKIDQIIKDAPKGEKESLGISIVIDIHTKRCYLNDFSIVRQIIADLYLESKISQNGDMSRVNSKRCSVTNRIEEEIYGFAAPFKYSSADKPSFISGFFNKNKFWRTIEFTKKSRHYL